MDINKISFTNFRIFKEETTFLLRPFTILTGPNNSGKSSLIKFLLLLKEGCLKFNFDKGKHNLESLSKVLSWGNTSKKIKISTEKLGYQYNYQFNENGELDNLTMFNNNQLIIDFHFFKGKDFHYNIDQDRELLTKEEDQSFQQLNFKFDYIIESILFFLKLSKQPEEYKKLNAIKNNLFFDVFFEDINVTADFYEVIRSFQDNYMKDIKVQMREYDETGDFLGNNLYELLLILLEGYKDASRSRLRGLLKKEHNAVGVRVEYSELGKIVFEDQPDYYNLNQNYGGSFNWYDFRRNKRDFPGQV